MEWISVETGLPNKDGDYLIAGEYGIDVFYFDTHWMEFDELDGPRNHEYVTHWMPLPPPPQNLHEPATGRE